MKKYYLGLLVIALFTVGLTIFGISQAAASKQDKQTEKRAREIAKDLNKYVSSNGRIPESLDEAGIKDIPSTIKYEKKSESQYEFCATYRAASKYTGLSFEGALSGSSLQQLNRSDQEIDPYEYQPSSLYISYSHNKGENCRTVEPYVFSNRLRSLNLNDLNSNSSNNATGSVAARDTERETDIKALHGQVEAYYAQNGKYPTLANLNDATWRLQYMKGLNSSALRDPSSFSSTLVAAPTKNAYSYVVKGNNSVTCDNVNVDCTTYTLTATLEKGGTYSKLNLN